MRRADFAAIVRVGWLLFLISAGCVPSLPNGKPRAPNKVVPASYGEKADQENSALVKWNEFFTDPKLNELIATALKNNQELNILSQEVYLAQYELMSRKGEYWPKVGFQAGVGIEKVGRHTSQGAADEANGVPEHLPDFMFGFTASWEIDIWGKLRNAAKAAAARYLSSQEGRKFAVTVLVGEIASAYYELVRVCSSPRCRSAMFSSAICAAAAAAMVTRRRPSSSSSARRATQCASTPKPANVATVGRRYARRSLARIGTRRRPTLGRYHRRALRAVRGWSAHPSASGSPVPIAPSIPPKRSRRAPSRSQAADEKARATGTPRLGSGAGEIGCHVAVSGA
jgi:hypothetical protein